MKPPTNRKNTLKSLKGLFIASKWLFDLSHSACILLVFILFGALSILNYVHV